jgi:hypothetical protein
MNALPNTESPTAATQQRKIAATRFEKIATTRLQNIAATRRQGVDMGMSPWIWMQCRNRRYSPEGTTGHAIHVAPPGLGRVAVFGDHGLTPMAKTFCPFGTVQNQTRLRLAGGRGTQFAESAKLEQAIKANLRGLGYGG